MFSFTVNSKKFNINLDNKVESIMLFGSCARGDNDEFSDLDLLFIIEDCDDDSYIQIKRKLHEQLNIPEEWISLYKKSSIENMNKYTSYFLWHLKLEGRIVYSKSNFIRDILENLKEYKKTSYDLYQYKVICNDIEQAISEECETCKYELNILASLARNTCMALCYINGKKVFGRSESVENAIDILKGNCPFNIEEYKELYKFRSDYKNKTIEMELKSNIKEYTQQWCGKVKKLINLVWDKLLDKESEHEK
ncbi:nucleotidyltransferase domain-containing protein [Clostridium butyricum]|uniref:nucleotidyltransferase domain-containing protein n=1 Tax=Clostridium TaxID=1485 RepID=UPI00224D6D36|nr:nucleotidyltransferase domain-containing protein [Clostridium sp. LQ25]UZT08397.1 nucleotidyltransferase domain-containing protein [Clostridium sp. LQ25]